MTWSLTKGTLFIMEWSLTKGPFHAKQKEIEASLVFDKRAIVAGSLANSLFSVQDPFILSCIGAFPCIACSRF